MDNATPVVVKAAPSPKSPPRYPDFCGRRRLQLEVQILNREIGFLEFCCHCCCQKRRCCRDCSSHKDCSCCNYESRCPHCAVEYPCCQCKCAECSPCACFEPRCDSAGSCSCPCHCFRLPSCGIRRCKLSCYPFRCCGRRRSETPCCSMPQCAPCDPSPCMPWTWRCCCCCNPLHHCCCCRREASCPLPRPLCPDLSCGCVWSCPKCTEARLCRSCCSGKSSCITGCLC